jgi:hypothetical protein
MPTSRSDTEALRHWRSVCAGPFPEDAAEQAAAVVYMREDRRFRADHLVCGVQPVLKGVTFEPKETQISRKTLNPVWNEQARSHPSQA